MDLLSKYGPISDELVDSDEDPDWESLLEEELALKKEIADFYGNYDRLKTERDQYQEQYEQRIKELEGFKEELIQKDKDYKKMRAKLAKCEEEIEVAEPQIHVLHQFATDADVTSVEKVLAADEMLQKLKASIDTDIRGKFEHLSNLLSEMLVKQDENTDEKNAASAEIDKDLKNELSKLKQDRIDSDAKVEEAYVTKYNEPDF